MFVGTHCGKPAYAYELPYPLQGARFYALKYLMPDGSTLGPYPVPLAELGNMGTFPDRYYVFGPHGYMTDTMHRIYDHALRHAVNLA